MKNYFSTLFQMRSEEGSRQPTVILHFGAHKTGTSVVQRSMRDNASLFRSVGVDFVERRHTDAIFGWGQPETLTQNLPTFCDVLASRRYLNRYVISHENSLGRPFLKRKPGLYPNRKAALDLYSSFFDQFNLKVIYYIRPQSVFVNSYYLQTVHEGSSVVFDDWVKGVDLTTLYWTPVINDLKLAFPQSEVIVKDFTAEISLGPRDFVCNFCRLFGADLTGIAGRLRIDEETNISVGDRGLDLAIAINKIIKTKEEKTVVRRFLQRHFNNKHYPRPNLLSKEVMREMDEQYMAEYETLVQAGPLI